MSQVRYSQITGIGGYLPKRALSNDDLRTWVDTSDDWVRSRTGIGSRHIAAEGELASDLALPAAKNALVRANINASDLDMIIVATTTPDRVYPSTACLLQKGLGAAPCAAFDVQAVCSGFLYALSIGDSFIRSGQSQRILVVGAEVYSHILDWKDRGTCVLFGDGAGAAVLEATNSPGIMVTRLYADGRYADTLTVHAHLRGGKIEGDPYTRMDGGMVYRFAVEKMTEVAKEVIAEGGCTPDWLVLHQANSRIISAVRKQLGISAERTVLSIAKHGNTSAASIPLALADSSSKFKDGDTVLLVAVGGGFTWGATMLTWRDMKAVNN